MEVSIVMADIKNIDVERSSLRSLGSGRRMLIMTMKKCVHVHLRGGSRGRVEGFAHPHPPQDDLRLFNSTGILAKKKLLVYWCWSKTRDEVGEFMLNALKMVVCLNSAVSFNMYSQQFTLCWCEVYEIIFTFTLCYCLVKSLQKPSSWYSLLKFVYVTSQLHHSLVMQPLLWKILDPPLHLLPAYSSITLNTSLNNLIPWFRLW